MTYFIRRPLFFVILFAGIVIDAVLQHLSA